MVKKIDNALAKLTSAVSIISYVGIVFIILLIVLDVLLRKFFASSVLGAYEIVERALMCIVFASFAYTQTNKGHVSVTMFISKFPRAFRFLLLGIVHIISTTVSFMLSYAAFLQVTISMKTMTKTVVLGMPLYPFFFVESICMLVFGVVLLWDTIKIFLAVQNDEIAAEIQRTWN